MQLFFKIPAVFHMYPHIYAHIYVPTILSGSSSISRTAGQVLTTAQHNSRIYVAVYMWSRIQQGSKAALQQNSRSTIQQNNSRLSRIHAVPAYQHSKQQNSNLYVIRIQNKQGSASIQKPYYWLWITCSETA